VAFEEMRMYEFQVELTKRALEIYPDDPWASAQHGQALLNIRRVREALATYDAAIQQQAEAEVRWCSARLCGACFEHGSQSRGYTRLGFSKEEVSKRCTRLRPLGSALGLGMD